MTTSALSTTKWCAYLWDITEALKYEGWNDCNKMLHNMYILSQRQTELYSRTVGKSAPCVFIILAGRSNGNITIVHILCVLALGKCAIHNGSRISFPVRGKIEISFCQKIYVCRWLLRKVLQWLAVWLFCSVHNFRGICRPRKKLRIMEFEFYRVLFQTQAHSNSIKLIQNHAS